MKTITRTVWILSIVSLFTDMASEMLYPIMPMYLKSIGFSILFIGILEGIAEATAGLSKGYFGMRSDISGKRTPFVQVGYSLSAISKPMMALFVNPLWVFASRTLDRMGKGIRTGARDAILSDEATPETKGTVFGLHRSMDTMGAVLGPSIALIYLYFYPQNYRHLFLIAFVPGLIAIACTFILKEKPIKKSSIKKSATFFSYLTYWKESPVEYRKLIYGLLLFALFNSSDIFLLLKAKQSGLSDAWVIGIYIFYNLIYAVTSYPIGILADKIGLKKLFVFGLTIFSVVYVGMAFAEKTSTIIGLFFLYGMYAAATEGISKAWISNIYDKNKTATAIGTYASFQSICAMLASSVAGLIWYNFGATATFLMSGFVAMICVFYFLWIPKY